MDYAVVLFQRLGNELLEPQLLCLFVLAAGMVVGHFLTYAYYRLVVRQLRELKGAPPTDIYVTRHGQCYHSDAFCPSLRNSQPTGKRKCHLCYPYTSTGP
ncbi:unnamed protein product [Symbiodinium natans]|uniref:Uncharacterized protein n=1 Tax=Symbiodinium natans TaxID=878477 RepID=A0A812KBS0_9DINO|nr:unnamed protein product [Symbiodinium natans]